MIDIINIISSKVHPWISPLWAKWHCCMLMILVFTQSTGCVARHATVPDAMAQARWRRTSLEMPMDRARPRVVGSFLGRQPKG